MHCPFCGIIEKHTERIVRESEHTFTVLSNPRLVPGHTLVLPKRHVEKLSELTDEERKELLDETITLQEKILEHVAPGCDISQHYRPFIEQDTYKVNHLHVHIRPRWHQDELYEKVQKFESNVFKELPQEEIEQYTSLLSE